MKKRFLAILLALVLVVGVMPTAAVAATSGTCGDNVTWSQDGGVLTISGEGYMKNYTVIPTPSSPWSFSSVNTIKIEDGVYNIGSCAFGWMFSLKSVEIPKSVIAIGSDAFNNSRMITDIYYAGTEDDWNNIYIASGNYTLNNAVIHYNSKGTVSTGDAQHVLFERMYENGTEYAVITGVDANGDTVWTHITDHFTATELSRTDEIGIHDSMYIFNAGGTITALDWKTGNVLWENSDFRGASTHACFDAHGNLYVCGYYGPHFFAVDGQGNTLSRIESFDANYGWADWIKLENNNVVSVSLANAAQEQATFYVNLTDYSYFTNLSNIKKEYNIFRNGGSETFTVSLEDCLEEKQSSGVYNPDLAYMLISMCNSVYSRDDMAKTFDSFGFSYKEPRYEKEYITYSVAKKQMKDGTPLVLVVAKGSGETYWEDQSGWSSNIWGYISTRGDLQSGFADAADEVYRDIKDILKGDTEDLSRAKFVLTGFSRGAATANILAAKLNSERVAQSHIYAYTFACPDTTRSGYSGYDCIFNINDAADFLSWTPSGSFGGPYSSWNKFGRSYWFSDKWGDMNLEMGTDAHNPVKYMEFLYDRKETSEYKKWDEAKKALEQAANERDYSFWKSIQNKGYHQIGEAVIACPVDVEVYASGQLVGSVINNMVRGNDPAKVYISVINDEKNIYLLDDDTYTFNLTATDNGTMEYTIQNIDVATKTAISEQIFENVELIRNKEFTSAVTVEKNVAVDVEKGKVKLYVIGSDDQPEKEVLPDGKGTEIPYEPKQPTLPTVESIPAAGTVYARTQTVKLDGSDVEFQCYAVKNAAGNETNYVKVRDLAMALNGTKAQFNVAWDGKIGITSGTAYQAVGGEGTTPYSGDQPYRAVSDTPVRFNGSAVKLTSFSITYRGGGYTYYKLRDLGQLLDFNVKWDGTSVVIETDRPYTGK